MDQLFKIFVPEVVNISTRAGRGLYTQASIHPGSEAEERSTFCLCKLQSRSGQTRVRNRCTLLLIRQQAGFK
jgi:hypothetical protein